LHTTGALGMAGVGFGEMTFDFISMISGRIIRGILEGDSVPGGFIPHLARLNAEGRFPFHELITNFALEDINDAEAASASGEVIKPVLLFS
ncbi:MAG: NAD(P)-dependent alcohol dehydrogenase, partial [Acidimicrobiales bacterium]